MYNDERYRLEKIECEKISADMKERGVSMNCIKVGALQAASVDVKKKFSTDCSFSEKINYAVSVFMTLSEISSIDLETFMKYVMPNE